ncbi:unnamed protein product [Peronospora belbahrii]|uniref:Asparagine synthetase domain-containing protein n=1 Tax=Peronospora belbahrii TaxID=622444 RepID=A0ABN8DAQ8_9STRA|nr:unnamed protein product [Peronospora belbahrii]
MCGIGLVLTALDSTHSTSVTTLSSTASDGHLYGKSQSPLSEFNHNFEQRLCQRGPDSYHKRIHHIVSRSTTDKGLILALHSAVLHLRGNDLIPQPIEDSDQNVLCWNGEIFEMGGRDFPLTDATDKEEDVDDENDVLVHGSDTVFISNMLQLAGRHVTTKEARDPVVEVLRRVRGPFAVMWLHVRTKRVYFAHDRFGRRSLLYKTWGTDSSGDMIAELAGTETTSKEFLQSGMTRFVLTNVAIGDNDQDLMQYQELPASGIYVLDLRACCEALTNDTLPSYRMEFHPYAPLVSNLPLAISKTEASNDLFDRFGCKLPCPGITTETIDLATKMLECSARALLVALSNAVGIRVRSIPVRSSIHELSSTARVAVLFSGGLDSVVLAALTHFHAPAIEPVDLLTVCFDESSNYASPDRLAAELAHAELCSLFPERQWNLIKVNVPHVELSGEQREIQTLMAPCDTHMDFNIGAAFWFLARGRGVLTESTQASEMATLEELNAFLKPHQADLSKLEAKVAAFSFFDDQSANGSELLCPVLSCGRKRKHGCVLQVCKTCCFRIQREVNRLIPLENQHGDQREVSFSRAKLLSMGVSEAQLERLLGLANQQDEASNKSPVQQHFSCCVHRPKQTALPILSNSTSAFSQSDCTSSPSSHYETPARVVLVGIGADEQLAGYGRHRTTLMNGGEQALRAELQMDLARIWKRNLGRDDRCIAAHGREARFPYLDETVVATISTFPVSSLCDANLPRGVGDKRVLRLVANTLGLRNCALLAKRAIQFGSRIAKVSNTGSNRQTHGNKQFLSTIPRNSTTPSGKRLHQ